jgi:hypothetical protein
MDYFLNHHKKICRKYDFTKYYNKHKDNINLAVFIVDMNDDEVVAFNLSGIDGRDGMIYITCGKEGVDKVGLLARYVGMKVMFNVGVKYVYNEALNKELIGYYEKLGFRLGKKGCEEKDVITDRHEKKIKEGKKYIPRNYVEAGYKMKFCSKDLNELEKRLNL